MIRTRHAGYIWKHGIYKLTIGILEEINRRDVNTVRRPLRRAEPRSSDPIQRYRAATRKSRPTRRTRHDGSSEQDSARIRWSRCGLVLIGSTSWIVDDGLNPVVRVVSPPPFPFTVAPSYFRRLFDGRVILRTDIVISKRQRISRFSTMKFSQCNFILDIFAN